MVQAYVKIWLVHVCYLEGSNYFYFFMVIVIDTVPLCALLKVWSVLCNGINTLSGR